MDENCNRLKNIAIHLESELKKILNEGTEGDISVLLRKYEGLEYGFQIGMLKEPCNDCGGCIDFYFYQKLSLEFLSKTKNLEDIEKSLQFWDKQKANDKIITQFANFVEVEEFPLGEAIEFENKVFYPDFNIFDGIKRNSIIASDINLTLVFSGLHLEEVYRMGQMYRNQMISIIAESTKHNAIILMDREIEFYKLDPKYSYNRVLSNTGLSDSFEQKRIVETKDRKIYFKNLIDKYALTINNLSNVFGQITSDEFSTLLNFGGYFESDNDFKKVNKSFWEVHSMVYALYGVLDNISYNIDKNEKTIKSSVYDIEHIIYASFTHALLTCDKKMANRAKAIYMLLNIETKVYLIDPNEFDLNIEN